MDFVWSLMRNSLPTKQNIQKRGMNCLALCPRCLLKEESDMHLFRDCEYSQRFWFLTPLTLRPLVGNHLSLQSWVESLLNVLDKDQRGFFCACLYAIWKARNILVFENKCTDIAVLFDMAKKNFEEFCSASIGSGHSPTILNALAQICNQSWRPPPPNRIKINTDAALVANQVAGAGAIARDSNGAILAAATWELNSDMEPHLAEAQACLMGMQLAKDCCFLDVELESDNLEVVLALLNARVGDNYFGACIADCLNLTNSFRSVNFLHVKREGNRVAHSLANLALSSPNLIWLEDAPEFICNLASLDCLKPMMC